MGIGVAAAVLALSYAGGGFSPVTRSYAGIAAWWLLGAGAAIGLASARAGVNRLALIAVGLLGAFAVWILISVNWAADAARAFEQFNQVSLYVAVLAVAIVLARLVPAPWVVGGVALAVYCDRCDRARQQVLPELVRPAAGSGGPACARGHGSVFPLGYWNGLGIEVALAYPLLLAIMTARRSRVASALAALPLPALAAVMYLTSSRGAFVAAAIGVIAFLVLTPRRWPALVAVVVAGLAGAIAVAVLVHKTALVNGEMDTALAVHQGHRAALSDRRRLRRDGARLGRARRAGETHVHAASRRRGGNRGRGRRPGSRRHRRESSGEEVRPVQEQQHRVGRCPFDRDDDAPARDLRQRAVAVLERLDLRVQGPSAQRRRRRFVEGLVAPARLAARGE